jgi:hypothetical protein
MTPAQAEESVAQDVNYYLCVVQLKGLIASNETVRSHARFVPRIGLKLKPLVDALHRVQVEENSALSSTGDVQLSIRGTLVRFQIKEQIWANALDIDAFKVLMAPRLVQ